MIFQSAGSDQLQLFPAEIESIRWKQDRLCALSACSDHLFCVLDDFDAQKTGT